MVTFDTFGPEKILEVYDPITQMHGFVVIDNTKRGRGKGGIRMTPSVSVEEVARLARAMTWKNSLADLPFGGAKAGIIANDKKITKEQKKLLIQSFARSIKAICPSLYIAGPDMNTTEEEMQWFVEANGDPMSATGKPAAIKGIPHELGSTGFGVAHATKVALEHLKMRLKNTTVAIEGYGNVGVFAAKHLAEFGLKIVAVSDSKGVLYTKEGIDVHKLAKVKEKTGSVTNYKPGVITPSNTIVSVQADVLITAAIPDLIKDSDLPFMKFKVIVCGSNIPMSFETEEKLHKKKVLVIPDFVANAGGVISSYAEHIGSTPKEMFRLVESKIVANTKIVLDHASKKKIKPRDAAMEIAVQRVKNASE